MGVVTEVAVLLVIPPLMKTGNDTGVISTIAAPAITSPNALSMGKAIEIDKATKIHNDWNISSLRREDTR
jgi:hypothetical protein